MSKLEDEILAQVEASAQDMDIPKSLEPEAVKERLKAVKKRKSMRRFTEAAAAIALVAMIGGGSVFYRTLSESSNQKNGTGYENTEASKDSQKESITLTEPKEADQKKQVIGSYHLAKSYQEVFAAAKKVYRESGRDDMNLMIPEAAEEMETVKGDMNGATSDAIDKEFSQNDASMENSHSTTNTQVEGVDESDFVKNDGKYLYIQTNRKIQVIDIMGETMETVAVVEPEMEESDSIRDIYLDENQLYLIIQKREKQKETGDGIRTDTWKQTMVTEDCCFWYNTDTTVELMTYDVTDKDRIRCVGTVSQEGSFHESRKVGDFIYLFTRKDGNPYRIYDEVEPNYSEESSEQLIPKINGKKVSCDDIYVKDDFTSAYIMSSVNVHTPTRTEDEMVIMDQSYVQLYMGTDGIYLYESKYEYENPDFPEDEADYSEVVIEERQTTVITKFSYANGHMNGVGEATLEGHINDTFAISEANGILRVLTTEWKWDEEGSKNRLYLYNENLNRLSCLEGIATGEEVYAARFIGNVAYFITYHNTDPLFAVDISDPKNPKILDQVEITGFSDYLHPYGDGLLLGIGYETDPETSARLGVKLVMFDISNPGKLDILDTVILDGTYCGAADFYKSALVSSDWNLIGFDVNRWDAETKTSYHVFSWENGGFVERMSTGLGECWNSYYTRGLYANNKYFVLSQSQNNNFVLTSFDMNQEFKQLDEMIIESGNPEQYVFYD